MPSTTLSHLRAAILLLLATYLFVYPFGILLICLDIVPPWGTWMGGALLIMQGTMMGLWLVINYGRRGLLAALSILLFSWAVEHIGVTTGFPFGGYHYTDTLTVKVLGVVPLAVPFAWLMVVPAAAGIVEYLLHQQKYDPGHSLTTAWGHTFQQHPSDWKQRISLFFRHLVSDIAPPAASLPTPEAPQTRMARGAAKLGAVLKTIVRILGVASVASLLDLLIEPVAVDINGYWVWDNTGGGYYGVPGSNFAAWWVTSAVLAAILFMLARVPTPDRPQADSTAAQQSVAPLSYAWLPPLLYMLNLMMFVLVTLAHGKHLAVAIGVLLLGYLALARLRPRLIRSPGYGG